MDSTTLHERSMQLNISTHNKGKLPFQRDGRRREVDVGGGSTVWSLADQVLARKKATITIVQDVGGNDANV